MRQGPILLPLSLITKSESGNIAFLNLYFRDYNDFTVAPYDDNKVKVKTIDKYMFELQGENYGAIDIKINAQADRLAVSSIDSEVTIYNIQPEKKLTVYKNLSEKYAG